MNIHSLIAKAGKVIPSRFLLSKIVTERVRQLKNGAKPKIDCEEKAPLLEIALIEISEGKIELVDKEET